MLATGLLCCASVPTSTLTGQPLRAADMELNDCRNLLYVGILD